jgi:GGDEF domain-containing protein
LLTAQQTSPEDILKCADIAMYQAKREGGNRVRFYE